jgi:hypothetical protein
MNYYLALLLMAATTLQPTLNIRRLAKYPFGPSGDPIVCCDSDHDSLPDLIFRTYHPSTPSIEIWEHQGWNRFKLVYADTGALPEPNGITTGNAVPYDAGDVDDDGRTDILCGTIEFFEPDSTRNIMMTLESPDPRSYPSLLSWYYPGCKNGTGAAMGYIKHDFGHDGHNAIVGTMEGIGALIWENAGNDSNVLVWNTKYFGPNISFGDFDCDGRDDMACSGFGVYVREDTGNCQYEVIWEDTFGIGGGQDCWSTSDIDGDGRPEVYASYYDYFLDRSWLYMYEAESAGSHQFTHTLVDSVDGPGGNSAGGDIDGDGVDECIWTTLHGLRVYRAFGNDDLQKVWEWQSDHVPNAPCATVYDVNGDGYNELLLAQTYETSIFEVDAVDLVFPNGASCSVGDTVGIRWAVNAPPRCDSLSLFLRRDSSWSLDTIATGLPGTDTLYRWVVPSSVPDTGRIVVMAYGPGHQWDMSDSVITFIGGGVAEGTHSVPLQWSLSVSPNPARGPFSVRYDVPRQSRVSVGVYDAGGRLVRSLSEGEVVPGRYEARLPSGTLPAGIYFFRLDTPGFRSVKKAVVAR